MKISEYTNLFEQCASDLKLERLLDVAWSVQFYLNQKQISVMSNYSSSVLLASEQAANTENPIWHVQKAKVTGSGFIEVEIKHIDTGINIRIVFTD